MTPPPARSAMPLHRLAWTLVVLAIVVMLAVMVFHFPWDMDEILPYHTLSCSEPAQQVNAFTGACNSYPTQLGPFEFQRPFIYIGAVSGWLMAPLFAVAKTLWLHSLMGVVVLALAGWGFVKSVRLDRRYFWAAFAFFPIAFATIHDTGPIRLSLLVIAWTPVAVRVVLGRAPLATRILTALVVLGIWLAATESKPFFLYLIPGIAVWVAACMVITEGTDWLRRQWLKVGVLLAALSAACVALLLVLQTEGQSYLAYLMAHPVPNYFGVNLGTGLTFLTDWPFIAQRFMFLYPNVDALFPAPLQAPLNALPVTPDRGGLLALALTLAAIVAGMLLYVWSAIRLWKAGRRVWVLWIIGASAAFMAGALASGGGSNHHFVFMHVPLLAMVLIAFTTRTQGALRAAIWVTGVSVLSLLAVVSVPLKPPVSPDVDIVMSEAINANQAGGVVNCQSWGCYYQYAFFNRDDVPIVWAETTEQQALLLKQMKAANTPFAHVCLGCTQEDVAAGYPGARIESRAQTPSGWRWFEVQP